MDKGRKGWLIILALLALVGSLLPPPAAAQGDQVEAWTTPDPPPWRQNLACERAAQQYRGMEYCTAAQGQVHVVVLDLHSAGLRLEYVIAAGADKNGRFDECKDVNIPAWGPVRGGCADPENPAYYPVMSLTRAVELARQRDNNTAAVINSDYGAGTQGKPGEFRGHGPEGFTVVRGDRLDGPTNGDGDNNAIRRPWLAVGRNVPLRAELGQLTTDNGSKPDWVYTGVGGGPWLIRNGSIQQEDIRTCKNTPGSCYDGAAQTAAGLSQDRRWLFLVVDVRKGKLTDTAQFMRDQLAAWDAIKFDGGGSSQLWYGGQTIEAGDGRQLSQYLAVIAAAGTGIEDQPATPLLAAQPTAPLFFDTVLPGEAAHLRIEVRNTGQSTWQPSQGIELRRVRKDTAVAERYPLPRAVSPGETVAWDITFDAGGARFTTLRFQMYEGDRPFGPEVGAIVITIPEQLKAQEEKIRQAIEQQLREWQQQAEQELEQRLEELQKRLLELIQREVERQAQSLIEQLCGAGALLPAGVLALWWARRRR